MRWEVYIQAMNGREKVLYTYKSRETALRCVDQIYSQWGYPMHCAYLVRPALSELSPPGLDARSPVAL